MTPADTTPADTTPADTTPADTTPADTTPADTTPADTTAADTTAADTTPAGTPRWDPGQYGRFAAERARPFHDLLDAAARVLTAPPRRIVDLGCGPGELTGWLAERFAPAQVIGVDSSAEMLERARGQVAAGRCEFVQADLATWDPPAPCDLIVSNAALQWVPGHLGLFGRWAATLASGGLLAVQVPGNFHAPVHALLYEMATSPRWSAALAGTRVLEGGRARSGSTTLDPAVESGGPVATPEEYLRALLDLGLDADVWETTYLHVLTGEDPVYEWMLGTGLRPVVSTLAEPERAEFLADYRERLRAAYPPHRGVVLLPFRRIFLLGRVRDTAR